MSKPGRRRFLGQFSAAAVVLPQVGSRLSAIASEALQAEAPTSGRTTASVDLLMAGGRVIDPAQKLSGERDVAISNGKISAIGVNLPRQARQVFDARGKIVTPGLIDMHGHVFDGVRTGIDPDRIGLPKGVTAIVDGGCSGSLNFPSFRKHVIDHASTRVYALLNLATIGLIGNELYSDPRFVDTKAAINMIGPNKDRILGIKVRINGRHEELAHDIELYKKAREVSDATGVPFMSHWTNEPDLLAIMKKGDILTHPFNPEGGGANLLGTNGKVLPQILELPQRGIFTDFAHGSHLDWGVAEKAAAQGWYPDTISTDIHTGNVAPTGPVFDLVTTMAKFMFLGLSLEQVIERVTSSPTKILNFPEKIGTLAVGGVADVTVSDLVQGDFELVDSKGQKRIGRQRLTPVYTVRAGNLMKSTA